MTIAFEMAPTSVAGLFTVEGKFHVVEGDEHVYREHPIDLGIPSYGTSASEAQVGKALDIVEDLCCDPDLGTPGRRNDDAVNLCIAAHVMGFDAQEWVGELCNHHCIGISDLPDFDDHIARVAGYLESWGPDDDRGRALEKTL